MSTITDVARLAGVSRSTVSRVLNDQQPIRAETRERVLHAIEQLNYRPSSLARSLVKQRTDSILVVSKQLLSDAFYAIVADELLRATCQTDFHILFYVNEYNQEVPLRFLDSLYGKVDGMIFLAAFRTLDRQGLLALKRLSLPMVLLESDFAVPGIAEINVDNYAGSYLATEKLMNMGHRRIAYLAAMTDANFEMRARLAAYEQALRDRGLKVDPALILHANTPISEEGSRLAPALLAQRPTAILCSNDLLAMGVIRELARLGVAVPAQVSVVGFDDIYGQGAAQANRPITTLHQPIHEMAEVAVQALIGIIGGGEPVSRTFPVEWVDGGTAGPVGG